MNAPLIDQLARYGEELDRLTEAHLDTATSATTRSPSPPSRRRALAAVAVSLLTVTAGLAVVGASTEPARAWTGWSAAVQVADLDDLAGLDDACRGDDTAPLVAADLRGDGAAAVYADEEAWMICQAARTDAGAFEPVVRRVHRADDLAVARAVTDTGRPVVTVGLGWHGDPAASFAWGVRDASVTGIELTTTESTIEASLHDDIWLAWWPDDTTHEVHAVGRGRIGQVLVDEPAGALAAPLPEPGVLAAEIADGGTPLEREVLADGIVTWAELRTGLDAWASCVADAGHELTIEIDEATRTYRAISETVSVPAPRGQPDDLAGEALLEPIVLVIDTCRAETFARIERIYVQQ